MNMRGSGGLSPTAEHGREGPSRWWILFAIAVVLAVVQARSSAGGTQATPIAARSAQTPGEGFESTICQLLGDIEAAFGTIRRYARL